MSLILKSSLSLGIIVYFIFIILFLRKKALNLKYTILWILSGIIMLIVVIWPGVVQFFSNIFGIKTLSNTVFALALFFLIIIVMSLSSIVSKLNDKLKRLTQYIALLEERVREFEQEAKNKS
jgi:hypothetical protein